MGRGAFVPWILKFDIVINLSAEKGFPIFSELVKLNFTTIGTPG